MSWLKDRVFSRCQFIFSLRLSLDVKTKTISVLKSRANVVPRFYTVKVPYKCGK
jgi:hypothetical protein